MNSIWKRVSLDWWSIILAFVLMAGTKSGLFSHIPW